jgi:hypothetical protein
MQQPVLSPEFWAKSLHILTQSPSDFTVACGIASLACHDEFFVNNALNVKETYWQALDVAVPVR